MNRHQKKALSLAAAIANLSFSIAVAGVATYAWYTATATAHTNVSDIDIECAIPNTNVHWKVLKFNDDTKEGEGYTGAEGNSKFFLDPYDSYIEAKNIHSNVLIRAELDYGDGAYYTKNQQIYIDVSCLANDYLENDNIGTKNYTSNIAQFKSCIASYVTDADIKVTVNAAIHDEINAGGISYNDDDEYVTATNYFKTSGISAVPFVTVHNNTPSKDRDNKIVCIPKFDCGNNNVKKIVVYLECSYNESLIKYYLDKHNVVGEIKFTGDISNVNFRSGDAFSGAYVRVTDSSEITTNDNKFEYMIGYSDWNAAFDGSLNTTTGTDIKSAKNYIPVEIHGDRIDYNEVTAASSWKYTSGSKLKGNGGYIVGRSSSGASSVGMNAGTSINYTNAITYSDGHANIVSNTAKLMYDKTQGYTQFNYIPSGSVASYEDIQLYKLDPNKSADIYPTAISVTSPKTNFYVGDDFEVGNSAIIEVTYSDTSEIVVNSSECLFTGYQMNQATTQTVSVTFSDNGHTVNTSYTITVSHEPALEIDFELLNVSTGGSKTLEVTPHYFSGTPTYAWSVASGSASCVTIPSGSSASKTISFNSAGTVVIRCTATYSTQSAYAECTINISEPAGYVKVNSLTAGDEVLIVTSDGSNSYYLPAATATSSPTYGNGTKVTITNDTISGNLDAQLFTVGGSSNAWTFTNSTGNQLYTTSSNTGVRISGTQVGTWSLESKTNGFAICYSGTSRYLGIYTDGSDWRSYTSSGQANYGGSGEKITFFKKGGGSPVEKALNKIMLSEPKTSYYTDDTFTKPTVTAYYTDGTTSDVTASATFSGYDLTVPGTQTVTVSYTDGVTKTATYDITITRSTLSSISIKTAANKTNFLTNSTFNTEGLVISATYSSGKSHDLENNEYSVSTPNMSTAGEKTITISYTEGGVTKTAEYTINVVKKVLSSLVMTHAPTKVTYNVGDTFSKAGATFKAVFNSDNALVTEEDTTITNSVTYDKTSPLTTNDTTVTFSYTYDGITETVSQAITVTAQAVVIKNSGGTEINELGGIVSQTTSLTAVASGFSNTPTYAWTIDDTSKLSITSGANSATPTVLFKAAGSTTISVTATSNAQTATKQINVTVTAMNLVITETTLSLTNATPTALTVSSNLPVTWTSSNNSVATVSNGVVTGVGNGTCTITGTIGSGDYTMSDTCTVTVSLNHTVTITSAVNTVAVNHTITLTATCSGGDAITWSSNNTSKATVNSSTGVVTGVAAGSARITATCAHGDSAYVDVTVTAHTLTINASGTTVQAGSSTYITLTADDSVDADESSIAWSFSGAGSIRFGSASGTTTATGASVRVYGYSQGSVTVTATCTAGGQNTTATKTITVSAPAQTEQVYKTLDFSLSTNSSVSSYTSTSTATVNSQTWTIKNGNNNSNGWDYYKFGRKNTTSIGYVKSPDFGGVAITKIVVSVSAVTSSKINGIYVYASNSSAPESGTAIASLTSGISATDLTLTISSPTSYKYYTVAFDCASGSSNGLISVTKVVYYYMA